MLVNFSVALGPQTTQNGQRQGYILFSDQHTILNELTSLPEVIHHDII
jgi:hypothetical protein